MQALLDVILPIFVVIGFGYLAVWRGWVAAVNVEGLMRFAQGFAIPCLLFVAIARLDLSAGFEWRLMTSFYTGAVASFVAAPAVGIFITNKLYLEGHYTQRESASIATNFSICSLGFFALLASIGGIMAYLPHMIIVSFIINFTLAALMVRIPPLSRKLGMSRQATQLSVGYKK